MAKTVVVSYTLNGELVKIYSSAKEASDKMRLFRRTIDRCIRGDIQTVKSLQWKRYPIGEVPSRIAPLVKEKVTNKPKQIAKLDTNGNVIEIYPSLKKAAISNHIDPHSLRAKLKTKDSLFKELSKVM